MQTEKKNVIQETEYHYITVSMMAVILLMSSCLIQVCHSLLPIGFSLLCTVYMSSFVDGFVISSGGYFHKLHGYHLIHLVLSLHRSFRQWCCLDNLHCLVSITDIGF